MKNRILFEVHSKTPQRKHCEACDVGPSREVTKWYEYDVVFPDYIIRGTCLDCCKDKMGPIIDWEEYKTSPYLRSKK